MTGSLKSWSSTGITFIENGNKYSLITENGLFEYRPGDILCELFRMDTSLIKDIIMQCDYLDDAFTIENVFAVMREFRQISPFYYFSPLIQEILFTEFSNVINIWTEAITYGIQEDFIRQFNLISRF